MSSITTELFTSGTISSSHFTYTAIVNTYYDNNRSEILILKSDLGTSGVTQSSLVEDIRLFITEISGQDLKNVKIGIKHTTKTTTVTGVFEPYSTYTEVFNEEIVPKSSMTLNSWLTFNFSSEFIWDGTSNLLITLIRDDNTSISGGRLRARAMGGKLRTFKSDDGTISSPFDTSTGTLQTIVPSMQISTNQDFSKKAYSNINIKLDASAIPLSTESFEFHGSISSLLKAKAIPDYPKAKSDIARTWARTRADNQGTSQAKGNHTISDNPILKWKSIQIPYTDYFSISGGYPVLSPNGDNIYAVGHGGSNWGDDGYGFLYCFDSKTGEKKWTTEIHVNPKSGFWGGATASPVISENGTIFLGARETGIYAIDENGEILWHNPMSYGDSASPYWADIYTSSPVIHDQSIWYGDYGDVTLNSVNFDGTARVRNYLPTNTQFTYTNFDYDHFTLDEETGHIYTSHDRRWRPTDSGSSTWYYVMLRYDIATGHTTEFGVDYIPTDYQNSWESKAPIITNDYIYIVEYYGNGLHAFDRNGVEVFHTPSPVIGNQGESYPALGTNGDIYVCNTFTNNGNPCTLICYDGFGGGVKWTYEWDLGVNILGSMAIASDGTIIVSGGNTMCLYAFNPDGELKWEFSLEPYEFDGSIDYLTAPLIANDGTIFVSSSNGGLYAVGIEEVIEPTILSLTIKDKLDFNYNGIWASSFGLLNISLDNSMFSEQLVANRGLNETRVRGNDTSLLHNVEESPLEFEVTIGFKDNFNIEKINSIISWLFKDSYKPLYFKHKETRIYYCIPIGSPTIVHNGLEEGYITFNMRCNSSHVYSPTIKVTSFQFFTVENSGHNITYPKLIIKKIGAGTLILNNRNDRDRVFEVNNLLDSEILTIDCERETISTNINGLFRYNNIKGDFIRFLLGTNNIVVYGDCEISLEYQLRYNL